MNCICKDAIERSHSEVPENMSVGRHYPVPKQSPHGSFPLSMGLITTCICNYMVLPPAVQRLNMCVLYPKSILSTMREKPAIVFQ